MKKKMLENGRGHLLFLCDEIGIQFHPWEQILLEDMAVKQIVTRVLFWITKTSEE